MKCIYTIQLLPITSIVRNMHPEKRERNYLKIKEETFFLIPHALRIRPKAALFSMYHYWTLRYPIYSITYRDDKNAECLFVFILKPYVYQDGFKIEIARCVGKRVVKKHWENVIFFLNDNLDSIKNMSENQSISFIQ